MIKPEIATSRIATACGDCGAVDRLLIHQVRHRGTFRRLCTSCVLRLHPQSFCPTCFQIYPPPPPNDAVVTCSKCYSSSHSQCVATPLPNPYICPLCVTPNSSIFKLKTAKEADLKTDEGSSHDCRMVDRDSAKKLVAAAKIASISMNRAAVAAKAEAERRAREAAVARKRAKEALEHVAYLVMKEKLRKREAVLVAPGVSSSVGYGFNVARVKLENNIHTGGRRNGIAGSYVGPSVVAEEKIDTNVVDRVDTSNQVLAALNAVELRENGKKGGVTPPPTDDDGVTDVDVDEERTMADADESVEEFISSDNHDEIFAEMEVATEDENVEGTKQDDVSNEAVSDKSPTDKMDCKENGNDEEQHNDDDNDDDENDDAGAL